MRYVTMATKLTPLCPDRCAVCDAAAPKQTLAYDIGVPVLFWGELARWLPGRRIVRIPVCLRCRRAKLIHDGAFFVAALLSVIAAGLTVVLNRNFFAANPVASFSAVVAILGPAFARSWWRLIRPEIQVHSHLFGVSYQFRGRRFFKEFMHSNAGPTGP